jgi:hypothetical protein
VPGRCSVVPDRSGFPTDMGYIGPVAGRTEILSLKSGQWSVVSGQ